MSLVISQFTPSHHGDWDDYAFQKQASIYHDSRWPGVIKNVFGHDSYHLMAIENEKIVGILPMVQLKSLLFGNFMVSMPYFNYGGIVADSNEISGLLVKAAQKQREQLGCSHVEFRFDKEQDSDLPKRTDKVTMLLDLPDDPEMSRKRRNHSSEFKSKFALAVIKGDQTLSELSRQLWY